MDCLEGNSLVYDCANGGHLPSFPNEEKMERDSAMSATESPATAQPALIELEEDLNCNGAKGLPPLQDRSIHEKMASGAYLSLSEGYCGSSGTSDARSTLEKAAAEPVLLGQIQDRIETLTAADIHSALDEPAALQAGETVALDDSAALQAGETKALDDPAALQIGETVTPLSTPSPSPPQVPAVVAVNVKKLPTSRSRQQGSNLDSDPKANQIKSINDSQRISTVVSTPINAPDTVSGGSFDGNTCSPAQLPGSKALDAAREILQSDIRAVPEQLVRSAPALEPLKPVNEAGGYVGGSRESPIAARSLSAESSWPNGEADSAAKKTSFRRAKVPERQPLPLAKIVPVRWRPPVRPVVGTSQVTIRQ